MNAVPVLNEIIFNPFDPEFKKDPYPAFARVRQEAPIHRSPFGSVIVARHADCVRILQDPLSSSDFRNSQEFTQMLEANDPTAIEWQERTQSFLFMDPPNHTRLRNLVSKAFTPRTVDDLRPRIASLIDEAIDLASAEGHMDIIESIAYPIPVTVICEMLGVPLEDRERFRAWSRELASSLDPVTELPDEVSSSVSRPTTSSMSTSFS
ncbi:MAG: hypothetical protein ABR507_07995 [Actinomycetota bacterium]|nr:cytochrome P450 [Actinomycetota bacterium]